MSVLKEILFWWMLIDNVLIVVSKKWRQHTIDMLSEYKKREKKTIIKHQ